MAIKASASITLSAVRDLAACTRYYLLQSSTLSPPAKPTANPPGGNWVTAEPSYTSGSTNSLYLCDLNVFSDGDYAYSDVSLSSSYEAAKAAYNKAQTAQAAANGANAQEQTIYISKVAGTNSVAATTTWVTNTAGGQNTWTLKRPVYNGSYPVLFVATQRKTVGGTVTCTTPLKDDTTTVIDGGHITTGTIDASRVTVTNLDADNITAGTLKANRIALDDYDSPFLIPDENDASTLFSGQSVVDGWVVGNGSSVEILRMEDVTEHRGQTLRISFVYPDSGGSGAPSGSFDWEIGGGQWGSTGFPAQRTYGQTDSVGTLIGPTAENDDIKYTVAFTIPQEATSLSVTADVPKVKAIAVNFELNEHYLFRYGTNVGIDRNGIQSGKFVVDRTGNVTSAGNSTFEGPVEMTGDLTVNGNAINDMAMVTFGTCSTAASSQVKAVTLSNDNWQLKVGSMIGVKFTNTNTYRATAEAPCKLNVNGTGEKQIYYNTSATPTGTSTLTFGYANRIVFYMYDGTYWVFMGASVSSTSDTIPSVYCTTVAGTAAKTASCSNFALRTSCHFQVLIRYDNTAQSALTLNINSTGAKPIYINGSASSSSNYTLPAGTYFVYYNGTNFYFRTDNKLTASVTGNAATATKATQDGDGNVISSTYLKNSDPIFKVINYTYGYDIAADEALIITPENFGISSPPTGYSVFGVKYFSSGSYSVSVAFVSPSNSTSIMGVRNNSGMPRSDLTASIGIIYIKNGITV